MTITRLGGRGATVLALLIVTIMALGGASVAQQKFQQVQVVNAPDQPVPVTGTVDVGNLPATQEVSGSVEVSNLPATQPITGSVGVDGPVEVTAAAPLPVAVQQDPAQRFVLAEKVEDVINAPACTFRALDLPSEALLTLDSASISVNTRLEEAPGAHLRLHVRTEDGSVSYRLPIPLDSEDAWRRAGGTLDLEAIPVDTRAAAPVGAIIEVEICINRGDDSFGPDAEYLIVGTKVG